MPVILKEFLKEYMEDVLKKFLEFTVETRKRFSGRIVYAISKKKSMT